MENLSTLRVFVCMVCVRLCLDVSSLEMESSAESNSHELSEEYHQFLQFMKDFKRSYSSMSEQARRFEAFKSSLKEIARLNREEKGTAVYGIGPFTDLTVEEFKEKMGLRPLNLTRGIDDLIGEIPGSTTNNTSGMQNSRAYADCFTWLANPYYPMPLNQKDCGSCTLYSIAGVVSTVVSNRKKKSINVSPQQLVDCIPDFKCKDGYDLVVARNYMANIAIKMVNAADYPQRSHGKRGGCRNVGTPLGGVTSFTQLYEESQIMNSVATAPVIIQFNADGIKDYSHGIIGSCKGASNHAAVVIGYGRGPSPYDGSYKNYYDVRNSWGMDWGLAGHFQLQNGVCDIISNGPYSVDVKVY